MGSFKLVSSYKPCGDQPGAIKKLTENLLKGIKYQTLLGVTGSGKTFTVANCIEKINKPVLVISHNKTLAAQLYREFKEFFPHNAVEYFVSYYDYYQPEAYIPQTDTYIEKDASINEELDKLRLASTSALMSRRDVIIVASVSCIYNLGSPEEYRRMLLFLERKKKLSREEIIEKLVQILYERNDTDFARGKFRVRGDVVEIFPSYEDTAIRVELFDDEIEKIKQINPLTGDTIAELDRIGIYPAKHFVASQERIEEAIKHIKSELDNHICELRSRNKLLEASRIESRTKYDIEMLREIGYCHGIENYSRHLSGRSSGARPSCLIDYFGDDFLTIIDESHVTIPQIRGMFEGDRARKETLVEFGFRLPSCLDNRPLKFDEFESLIKDAIFASATPAEYEEKKSRGNVVEQLIRPTGLVDPEIIVKPLEGQIDDLIEEIRKRAEKKERTLVTTLTKRMSEDLSAYLEEAGLRVKYLHSEIKPLERVKILHDLRKGNFDCLVGINLLREGLDLPEVSLVAILDADKEGFLRSQVSLIQVAGRAARHINGTVIMYAENITGSMKRAIEETSRRREAQLEYNRSHGITPRSVEKEVRDYMDILDKTQEFVRGLTRKPEAELDIEEVIAEMQEEMELAARNLHFERATIIRDQIKELREIIEARKQR
ncbi:MAG: excinuclease ABC subunit UvrB [Candidatus Omnitrophica bacterium]|nr:excinuclease ABC subunit UvrB [Candidatus Omnitrophota bacterium]